MRFYIIVLLAVLSFNSCAQNHIKTPLDAVEKLEAFKAKDKFYPDTSLFYPGLMDTTSKPLFVKLINAAADDFKKVVESGVTTEANYHKAIDTAIKRFGFHYVDTEDRERVGRYLEELMDIVGLQSSGGRIDRFVY